MTGHVARVGELRHVFVCCRIHWKAVTNNPDIPDKDKVLGYVSHPGAYLGLGRLGRCLGR